MPPATLQVQLECELPAELAVGYGTAVFVCGWCFSPQSRIRSLRLIVSGERQPLMAERMPRLDPFEALGDEPLAYRSGFWGFARLGGDVSAEQVELAVEAELESGALLSAEIGRIALVAGPRPYEVTWPTGGPRVAICMATYEPPPDLFAAQIASIRSQTHDSWVCVISDDCSSPESYAVIEQAVAGDPRFILDRSPRRLGFYANFERALGLAPADAEYVALSDQDDVWHDDKLTTLLAEIGDAQLIYSDARVISRDGELISDTWWNQRRNNHSSLFSLLVANAVTGAASLMRRDLLDYALPFPAAQFAHFHDHWVGLVACSLGEIAFVPRPLYDYVQHGQASLGHATANRMTALRDRLRARAELRERVRSWRLHYFADCCRLLQFATVIELRCEPRMARSKRRALRRFLAADRSLLSLSVLGARGIRELVGSTTETLGAEWMLFVAFAWRRLLALSARERPQRRLRLDALPPPSLISQPRRAELPEVARTVADKIAPLSWSPSDDAPARVNILIPTIDLQHFFGGYIGKFNLALRLARRGLRVRVVTVDPVGPLPSDWRRTIASFGGLAEFFDEVEVTFGREAAGIEVSRSDSFIATTWWTAHIANDALRTVGAEQFVYMIQEYEPFTFAMGSYAALATASYEFPHFALFSSELLRGYFRAHGIGVYEAGEASGDARSAAFENAITAVSPAPAQELADRRPRRLLLYGRPEQHAARNMFELAVLGLSGALREGAFRGWELNGIGSVGGGGTISLGEGTTLELLGRSDQRTYARLLSEHDVGLALMYTPHPSLVPIEMASAGMLTVTNSFENKTPEAMSGISPNLITVKPTIDGVIAGLRQAAAEVGDVDRRIRGSQVRWSRDWDQSFDSALLDAIVSGLGARRTGRADRSRAALG